MFKSILFIALGGAVGSVMRYFTSLAVKHYFSGSFPLATFISNVVGCFLIGAFVGLALRYNWTVSSNISLLLITGFCGGYPTFSAFAIENVRLLENGNFAATLAYIFISVIAGIASVWMGILLTK